MDSTINTMERDNTDGVVFRNRARNGGEDSYTFVCAECHRPGDEYAWEVILKSADYTRTQNHIACCCTPCAKRFAMRNETRNRTGDETFSFNVLTNRELYEIQHRR